MKQIQFTIQGQSQLPPGLRWLTTGERARYDEFRFEKRRRDWLLGRWAGKKALLGISGLSDRDIGRFEILSAPDGSPVPTLDGQRCRVQLSLSHSNGRALATVANGTSGLGCDIESVEPRTASFLETFFTASERALVAGVDASYRDLLVTMIWSAKESVLKALRTGLRADTYSVEVLDAGDLSESGWRTARVFTADTTEFCCHWRVDSGFVVTIATRDATEKPTRLPEQPVVGNPSAAANHNRRSSVMAV